MKKILIADDAKLNRDMLKEIFADLYDPLEAADGKTAIRLLEEYGSEIALILLDIVMPKKTGLEVMLYMQKKGLVEEIPVIIITGEGTIESDYKCYELGAADIFYKPYAKKVVRKRTENIVHLYESRKLIRTCLREASSIYDKSVKGEFGEIPPALIQEMENVRDTIVQTMETWEN